VRALSHGSDGGWAAKRLLKILFCVGFWLLSGELPLSHLNAQAQERQTVSGPDSASYLALVVRFRANDRSLCLLKATQISGKLVLRKGPSSKVIYEITKDDQDLVAGFLPEDPLTTRGFSSPSHPTENTAESESATILINAPSADLQAGRDGRLGIRVYILKAGVRVESVNPDVLKMLVADGKAALQFELSRDQFASQIRRLSER
jgi:hypothetical protein